MATHESGPRLVLIEPDVARVDPDLERAVDRRKRKGCRSETAGREATICAEPSKHWPAPGDPAWHLSDAFSQLDSARREVEAARDPAEPRIRIVHLDTGFDEDFVALPAGLDRSRSLDFVGGDPPAPPAHDPAHGCFGCQPGHGTGTQSLLAGSEMTIRDAAGRVLRRGPLGGAPDAEVFDYRISDSVIHLTTGRMVKAFSRAFVDEADVLSMSMGGLPSYALRDAVNEAYERGVAMFCAAGDFFQPPLLPLRSPKSVVYPARFGRVVAVTGATADRKTYARAANIFSWLRGEVGSWSLRGSYGPASAMGHAIAAYTPNVPWAVLSKDTPSNLLALDGAGTSASTPQVAAAAALWLERHRTALGPHWRTWRKTEAVYHALFASADAGAAGDAKRRAYSRKYFGAGLLKARDALRQLPTPGTLTERARSEIGFDLLELVTSFRPFADDPSPASRARIDLLRLEAAQLAATSVRIEKLLAGLEPGEQPSRELRRRLLRALVREPGVSSALRAALASAQ